MKVLIPALLCICSWINIQLETVQVQDFRVWLFPSCCVFYYIQTHMHHMLCRSWQDPMANLQTLVNCFLRVPWIHMLTTLTHLTERYFLVFLLADLTYRPLDTCIWSNVACIRICNVLESLHSVILNYVRAILNSSRLVEQHVTMWSASCQFYCWQQFE
jgi:hypothetical protein